MTRLVGYTLCALIVALTIAALADKARLRSLANAEALTWRQAEIIGVRARVHACQDRLGLHRSPVAQTIIVGGPAYRAWVLRRWRGRLQLCHAIEAKLQDPVQAILAVWGPEGWNAVRVFRCESGLSTTAENVEYLGLAQMGSWARANYGHSSTVLGQVRAAYALWRDYGWSQWTCARIVGVV